MQYRVVINKGVVDLRDFIKHGVNTIHDGRRHELPQRFETIERAEKFADSKKVSEFFGIKETGGKCLIATGDFFFYTADNVTGYWVRFIIESVKPCPCCGEGHVYEFVK